MFSEQYQWLLTLVARLKRIFDSSSHEFALCTRKTCRYGQWKLALWHQGIYNPLLFIHKQLLIFIQQFCEGITCSCNDPFTIPTKSSLALDAYSAMLHCEMFRHIIETVYCTKLAPQTCWGMFSLVISNNFNKGDLDAATPIFWCCIASTTPTFSKTQIWYFSLVLIQYNEQLEMPQLP